MKNRKQKILKNLKDTYCRLMPSKIDGVGIFAIRDIPKGIDPFFGAVVHGWEKMSPQQFNGLDSKVKKMIGDFFTTDSEGKFSVPSCGLNGMDISFYLNMSDKPNVKTIDDGTNFKTISRIKKGEELTSSYADYDYRYKSQKNE